MHGRVERTHDLGGKSSRDLGRRRREGREVSGGRREEKRGRRRRVCLFTKIKIEGGFEF